MRQQNTDIAWNGMMLRADVMLLHTDVTQFPVHTCMQQNYITVLYYMSVPTFTAKKCTALEIQNHYYIYNAAENSHHRQKTFK